MFSDFSDLLKATMDIRRC